MSCQSADWTLPSHNNQPITGINSAKINSLCKSCRISRPDIELWRGEDVYQMRCLIFRLNMYCGPDEIYLSAIWLAQKFIRQWKLNILSNKPKIKGLEKGRIILHFQVVLAKRIFIYEPTVKHFSSRE